MMNWKRVVPIVCIVVLAGAGIWVGVVKFEREKPSLQLLPERRFIGQSLTLKVSDQKSGVAEVRVEMVQQGKTVTLLSESYPAKTHGVEKTISLRPLPSGLKDGEVQIRVSARDHSWIHGNRVLVERNLVLDTRPPQISVGGPLHYFNQGGTGLVTYQASEEIPVSGVQVGDLFFPGYPLGKDRYLTYFAIPGDAAKDLPLQVKGEDQAGNQAQTGFSHTFKAKSFRQDRIQLSDQFLQTILPYFVSQDPKLQGNPLEIFLFLNQKQRETDHRQIRQLCQKSDPKALGSGPFLRLPKSKPMALFGDKRGYWYGGKMVDQQTHLGVDLASTNQSPIPAANSGRVVFAGPLGIYGNTVILDHGCGLFSLYAHLSRIETTASKVVSKGEILGRTGSTGMAGGDHLHFAMLVHGVFVNPVEWWDPHWIRDNVEKKLADAGPRAE
jgi:murein DD-endopeptidase MepM/ murein hydrolase activator NlpD